MILSVDFLVLLVFVGIAYYYLYKKYAAWTVLVSNRNLEGKGFTIYDVQQNLQEKGIKAKIKVIKSSNGDKSNPYTTALVVAKKDFDEASTYVKAYTMR